MFNVKVKGTTIEVQETLIVSTRFINHRICRVISKVDGTTKDLNKKILSVTNLDDNMFEEFARIQEEVQTND